MEKRIKWVDYCKSIGIILVMFGHLNSKWFPGLANQMVYVYTFHMPFFFILSGLFFNPNKTAKDFIINKFKTLIIPYYFYSFLSFYDPIKFYLQQSFDITILFESLYKILIVGEGLWYLISLFLCEIILYVLYKTLKKDWIVSITVILLTLVMWYVSKSFDTIDLPFQLVNSFKYFIYLFIGYILFQKNKIQSLSIKVTLISLIIGISLNYVSLCLYGSYRSLDSFFIYFSLPFFMSIFVIGLVQFIYKFINENCILDVTFSYIGKNSLIYYIFNGILLKFIKNSLKILGISVINSNQIIQFFMGCIVIFICCLISYPISLFINKYLPWSIGKRKVDSVPNTLF